MKQSTGTMNQRPIQVMERVRRTANFRDVEFDTGNATNALAPIRSRLTVLD